MRLTYQKLRYNLEESRNRPDVLPPYLEYFLNEHNLLTCNLPHRIPVFRELTLNRITQAIQPGKICYSILADSTPINFPIWDINIELNGDVVVVCSNQELGRIVFTCDPQAAQIEFDMSPLGTDYLALSNTLVFQGATLNGTNLNSTTLCIPLQSTFASANPLTQLTPNVESVLSFYHNVYSARSVTGLLDKSSGLNS